MIWYLIDIYASAYINSIVPVLTYKNPTLLLCIIIHI